MFKDNIWHIRLVEIITMARDPEFPSQKIELKKRVMRTLRKD